MRLDSLCRLDRRGNGRRNLRLRHYRLACVYSWRKRQVRSHGFGALKRLDAEISANQLRRVNTPRHHLAGPAVDVDIDAVEGPGLCVGRSNRDAIDEMGNPLIGVPTNDDVDGTRCKRVGDSENLALLVTG